MGGAQRRAPHEHHDTLEVLVNSPSVVTPRYRDVRSLSEVSTIKTIPVRFAHNLRTQADATSASPDTSWLPRN